MIGTTSSEEKAKLALAAGAHHVINYTVQDFVEEVKKITNEKVNAVYDGVGKQHTPQHNTTQRNATKRN